MDPSYGNLETLIDKLDREYLNSRNKEEVSPPYQPLSPDTVAADTEVTEFLS